MQPGFAARVALACCIGAATGSALGQESGPPLRLGLVSREAALGRTPDPVLQLKVGTLAAAADGMPEAGAALDLRQALGNYGSVRELTLYGAMRARAWRWQAFVSHSFVDADTRLGVKLRHDF